VAIREILYAWAVPALFEGSGLDHTWVTSYDNRISVYQDANAVIAARQDYWFCWGPFCNKGGTPQNATGFLGSAQGDLQLSRCLVRSNVDCWSSFPARGTIFTYGVDGVCHQLANQVLYSTGGRRRGPLTVALAEGYWLSSAVYGTYRLPHAAWRNKIQACSAAMASRQPGGRGKGESKMSATLPAAPHDEFEEHVNKVLGPRDKAAAKLLRLRAEFQETAAKRALSARKPTAAALNKRNQRFFDEAATILSAQDYVKVFGVEPRAKINLVRPEIMKRMQGPDAPGRQFRADKPRTRVATPPGAK
jgi:hypothetical protein